MAQPDLNTEAGLKLYEKLQSHGTHCLYIWGQWMTKLKKNNGDKK